MKKIIVTAFVVGISFSFAQAQTVLDKAKSGEVSSLESSFGVKSIASSVMDMLTPSLGLSATEKPGVLSEVTSLLTMQKDILSLQSTDKATYTSKFASLNSGFVTKVKGILTAAKYLKLLALEPKTASATNALSQLFF